MGVGVRDPLKSSFTGPSLLVNYYLEIKFHKKIPMASPLKFNQIFLIFSSIRLRSVNKI